MVPDAADFGAAALGSSVDSSDSTDSNAGHNAHTPTACTVVDRPYTCRAGEYHFVHFLHRYVDRPPDLNSNHDDDLAGDSSEARATLFADTLSLSRRAHSQGTSWPAAVPFLKNTGEQLMDSSGTYLSWIATLRTDPRSKLPPPIRSAHQSHATAQGHLLVWPFHAVRTSHVLAPRRPPRRLEAFRQQGPSHPPRPRLGQGRFVQPHRFPQERAHRAAPRRDLRPVDIPVYDCSAGRPLVHHGGTDPPLVLGGQMG